MNQNKRERGVLYCATGDPYLAQATMSARSLKAHTDLACAVCTDATEVDAVWDEVIPLEKSGAPHRQYMTDKLQALVRSPFKDTLYLDADTYVLDDIGEMFTLLRRFDIGICHGHRRQLRYDLQHGKLPFRGVRRRVVSPEIPYAFSPVQGGLLLFRDNPRTRRWLEDLVRVYREKQYYDDQATMRELLWTGNLKFYILPPEYNFNSLADLKRWLREGRVTATPKIFHYTRYRHTRVPRLVRRILARRFLLHHAGRLAGRVVRFVGRRFR